MSRIPRILTCAKDKKQVVLSLNLSQKIILTLLVATLATVPLWLGLVRAHSAPSNVASSPLLQPPTVVLNVPSEVLIGEDFEFEVRLKNNPGNPIGYAPYVDLYLPASGVDGNSATLKCDGITFLSARALFTSPPSLTLPVALDTGMDTSLNPCPNSYSTHPFTGATIFTPPLQYNPTPTPQYQLVVIPLPFGSFDPTQPENIIKVKARLSDYADPGMPLTIYAKGGFRYGTDEKDNHPSDPLVESPPISAQTTPTLFKIKKEYLGPEDEAVSGPNFVNYYPLKYRVTVDIADKQLIQNVVVTDKLPPNLQFNGNVQVTIQGNNANVVTSCSATPGPFDVVIASPTPSTSGGTLSVTLCSPLTGYAAADDVVVTFDFFIPDVDANGQIIINKDCSNAPVAVKNDILAAGDWDPLDPRDAPPNTTVPVNSNLTNVDHILNAKCLAIQKSVSIFQEFPGGEIGPTPGDVLRYELKFQVSDYFTIGKLVVTDFLADGQTFLSGPPPTIRVSDLFGNTGAPTAFPTGTVTTNLNQVAAAAFCPAQLQTPQLGTIVKFDVSLAMLILPPFIPRHAAGMLTGGLAASPPTGTPATGTIVFYAKINDAFKPPVSFVHKFVDKHDPINNCVSINGAVYDNRPRPTPLNAPLNIPNSIIGSAADGSAVQTTIVGADLKKTLWAVRRGTATLCGPATTTATTTSCSNLPNAPEEVRPGDQVTFRIEKPFPSGDSENVKIEDWLPLPIFKVASGDTFNNSACAGLPGPGIGCLGPTDTLHTLVAPAKPIFIPDVPTNSITFDYKDFNNTANTSLKIDLLFTYTVTNKPFADGLFLTNEARECEDNSFGVTFCQVSIAQVKVREPKLQIKKGVVATDNPHGVFTPALNPSGVWKPFGSSCPDFQNGPITSGTLGGLIDSNLSNVDANDQVTFGIAIENTGGAPACEIELADIIPLDPLDKPSCFDADFSSLCITDGSGTQIPFTTAIGGHGRKIIKLAPGFCLAPGSPANTTGTNIAIITFNAQLHSDITPGCCDNVAQLLHYTSQPGGPNFVDAGFTPPFSDNATVCVNPTLTKTLVATSEAHTAGSDVTIGEIARYRLVTLLPEGGSLTNFTVSDVLPAGMKFLNDGTASIAFVSNGLGITRTSFLGSTYSVNGATPPSTPLNATLQIPAVGVISGGSACGLPVNFNLGSVQNNDNDNDLEYIVIEFNALVCNEASNQNGTPLPNTFSVSVAGTQIATSNSINVNVVEPNLTMTKTVAPNPAVKGQTLTYTVQYTNNGTADAFDVELKDTLPPGLTLGTVTATCPFTNVPLNTLTMTCAQVPKAPGSGSTVIITYQAVANPATCPVTLNNQANLTWTSLPGLQGTTVNPTGSSTPGSSGAVDGERDGVTSLLTLNDYATTVSAPVNIDCPCCATPPGGMVSWWPLNEANGSATVVDIMDGNNGTPQNNSGNMAPIGSVNAPSSFAGQYVGNSLFFNQSNVDVPSAANLNFGSGEFSIDAWVRVFPIGSTGSVIQSVVDKTAPSGLIVAGYSLFVFHPLNSTTGQLGFVIDDANTSTQSTTIAPIFHPAPLGSAWYHVAVTVARPNTSSATITLYVNGVPTAPVNVVVGNTSNSSNLWIGKSRLYALLNARFREVGLDEIEIFNRALNAAEIQSIFKSGTTGKCTATIKGAKFNDLNGNGIRDLGEPGLANWTITVKDQNNNSQTTTTDSQGNYSFTVPAPTTYTVAEVQQSGWTQTSPTTGTHTVTVSPGQVINNLNFGNKKQTGCDLEIKKEVKPNPLVSGQQATATIIVKNVGTAPCHGPTQVAESMPVGLTLVSASVPGGNCVVSSGVCTYPPAILAGGSVVFTYVFNVTAQPGTSFENCARLKNFEDTNPTNNGTCVPLTVSDVNLPDLTIKKTVQCGGPAIPQGTCNVTLTIGNNGPGSFNGILVVQDLVTPPPSPALSLIGSSPGWSCSTGPPNNISCATTSSVSLATGQSTTLSLTVKIPNGQFKNCASVKGYTQFPYNSSTLIQESNFNNNESCVSMGGSVPGDCATPPANMVSWWPGDGNANDIQGSNNGTLVNGATFALGKVGQALSLDGADDYVQLRNSGYNPFPATGFTYDFWINPFDTSPGRSRTIISNHHATGNWWNGISLVNGSVELVLQNAATGQTFRWQTIGTLTPNAWQLIAVAYQNQGDQATDAIIYFNGMAQALDTFSIGPAYSTGFAPGYNAADSLGFAVGRLVEDTPGSYFRGLIDEVEIFNRSLSQSEIQNIYTAGAAGKCKSGSLTVTKTVENLSPSPIPVGTSFPVTVSCLPSGPNVTLNLAAGGTQTLNNIPVGSKCTVTEGPLPPPVSSPACSSLQWTAPNYSPGQSVTIPNSGAPQTVTIQNRLVCKGRPPVDTYAFTRGMNEFCIWGGGGSGSYNSPNLIGNTDLPLGFNSPALFGNSGGARFGAIGLCYGRILLANDKVAFKYSFNAIPATVLSYPDVSPNSIDGPFLVPVSATRRNVFGAGLSPIGLQLYFWPQKRIKPFLSTSGGFIFFNEQVPRLNGVQFNFTHDVGGGVQVFRDSRRAFTFGYKYQNISNGGRALNNPGFNGNVISLGYSIFK